MRNWFMTALYEAGWAPIAVFALHVLASRVLGLYMIYPSTDIAMHLMGGIAIAYFFWRCGIFASQAGVIGAVNRIGLAVLAFGLTCAAAVGWECAEYLSDRYAGTRSQLGLADTLGDMVCGIAGGVVFLVCVMGRKRAPPDVDGASR